MPRYLESRLIVFSASNPTVITFTLSLPIATQKTKLALKPKLNLFYYTLRSYNYGKKFNNKPTITYQDDDKTWIQFLNENVDSLKLFTL